MRLRDSILKLLLFHVIPPCFSRTTTQIQTPQLPKRISGYAEDNKLSISIVGDWGGSSDRNYTQHAIYAANAMDIMANPTILDTDFIFSVGDNFYEDGITSVEDARWNSTFNYIFDQNYQHTEKLEFYSQTGNHDYYANVSAEILYTQQQDRWKMPDFWYSIPNLDVFSNFTVAFITVDTDILKSHYQCCPMCCAAH